MNTSTDVERLEEPAQLRALLETRADALGIPITVGDAWIDAVLEREIRVPAPDYLACRRYYDTHPAEFSSGELVEASHVLFAVLPGADVRALVGQAEGTLRRLRAAPEFFEAVAAEFSNCPSGAQGGRLGQLRRGEIVPEIESVLFEGDELGVLPRLVRSRHGLHILRVDHRVKGERLAFEQARAAVEVRLTGLAWEIAARQFVTLLLRGQGAVGETSPLVQ